MQMTGSERKPCSLIKASSGFRILRMSLKESDRQLKQVGTTCHPGCREKSQPFTDWDLIVDKESSIWAEGRVIPGEERGKES